MKVALVRGASLNEWEGKLWEGLPVGVKVVGFCSGRNSFSTANLRYPITHLPCSSDSRLNAARLFYTQGVVQKMSGLESALTDFSIAHTAEISYFMTNQAVRAKKMNPNLKVVTTVWDNSFGRYEYNYWPGLAVSPKYWRTKIAKLIAENKAGVDLFLPVSESARALLLSYGVDESKIEILTPGVVMPDASDQSLSELAGLSTEVIRGRAVYMMVCRLVKEKGIYDVLYAWQAFVRTNPQALLLVIGNGPEKANWQRLMNELGLHDSVVMIDRLPNQTVRQMYKHARALILGSVPTSVWQEQFGYVLTEAIMNNCPVISTHSGAIPEVVGDAGILVSPGSPLELAEALQAMQTESVYQKLQQNCAAAQVRFSSKLFQQKLVQIYQRLTV